MQHDLLPGDRLLGIGPFGDNIAVKLTDNGIGIEEEFQDQIYYALSEVALKDNNDTLCIYYLRKSVSTSIQNNVQKTKSSLKVADMFFEKSDYK